MHTPREPDETGNSALTNTPIPMLGGLYPRKVQVSNIETFKMVRDNGTCKKVIVAAKPLKRSQMIDYFEQIREVSNDSAKLCLDP